MSAVSVKIIRITLTVLSVILAIALLGALKLSLGGGAIYGILSVLIVFGVPYATWAATGRLLPAQ